MRKLVFGAAMAVLVLGNVLATAHADSVDATCDVRKDGDKQKGKSGPCTFGQRQGYIDIDLKNGDTLSLSPAGGANQYHDQHHNTVHRVSSGTHTQEFKWEGGKHVIVTLNGNNYGSRNHDNNYGNTGYGAGAAGYSSSKERNDYQRGYDDGVAGRYDQYDHTQAYKDGVRAGESHGRGNDYGNSQHNGGGHGNYTIENIGNGDFEIKWPNQNCIADYDRNGNSTGYTNCNEDMRRRSDEVARHRAR